MKKIFIHVMMIRPTNIRMIENDFLAKKKTFNFSCHKEKKFNFLSTLLWYQICLSFLALLFTFLCIFFFFLIMDYFTGKRIFTNFSTINNISKLFAIRSWKIKKKKLKYVIKRRVETVFTITREAEFFNIKTLLYSFGWHFKGFISL